MLSETLKRDAYLYELKKVMRQIQCSCQEAEVQATNTAFSFGHFHQRPSVQNTLSDYELALSKLRDKCNEKDRMIAAMIQELRLRASSKMFDQMLQVLARAPNTERDFDECDKPSTPKQTQGCQTCASLSDYNRPSSPQANMFPGLAKRPNSRGEGTSSQPYKKCGNVKCREFCEPGSSKSLQAPIAQIPTVPSQSGVGSCLCGEDDDKATCPPDQTLELMKPPCLHPDYPNCVCCGTHLKKSRQTTAPLVKDVAVCSHLDFPNCACYHTKLPPINPEKKTIVKEEKTSEVKQSNQCVLECRLDQPSPPDLEKQSEQCILECRLGLSAEDARAQTIATSCLNPNFPNCPCDIDPTVLVSRVTSIPQNGTGPCGDVQRRTSSKKVVTISTENVQETQLPAESVVEEASSSLLDQPATPLSPDVYNCPCESNEQQLTPEVLFENPFDSLKDSSVSCQDPSCSYSISNQAAIQVVDPWNILPVFEDSESKDSVKKSRETPGPLFEGSPDTVKNMCGHPDFPDCPCSGKPSSTVPKSVCVPGCSPLIDRCANANFPNCPCSLKAQKSSPAPFPSSPGRTTIPRICAHPNFPNCSCALKQRKRSPSVTPRLSPSPQQQSNLGTCGHPNFPNCPCSEKPSKTTPLDSPRLTPPPVRPNAQNSSPGNRTGTMPPVTSNLHSKEPKSSQKSLCASGCSLAPDKCEHPNFPDCLCSDKGQKQPVVSKPPRSPTSTKCDHPDFPECPCTTFNKQQGDIDQSKETSCSCRPSKAPSGKRSLIPNPVHRCGCSKLQTVSKTRPKSAGVCPEICLIQGEEEPAPPPDQCSAPLKIVEIRKLCPNSLIMKWTEPSSDCVKGYEIEVDGTIKSHVYSRKRTSAVLHALQLSKSIQISIYAVSKAGRCGSPAKAVF